jgi:DNA-binding transcriptional regulator YhcF (GntR family)
MDAADSEDRCDCASGSFRGSTRSTDGGETMNGSDTAARTIDPELLRERLRMLSREALEETRPLSALLGEALAELGSALSSIRVLRDALDSGPRAPAASPGGDTLRMATDSLDAVRADGLEGDRGGTTSVELRGNANGNGGDSHSQPYAPGPAARDREDQAVLDLFDSPSAGGAVALEASLRARIAGALYLGTLSRGDRLPSIRELSRRTHLNHKVVRRVYRSLERCGLIEVRDRSGSYVAPTEPTASSAAGPMGLWIANVLDDAIHRGIPAGDLGSLFERSVNAKGLRFVCVEATEDDRYVLCRELMERFGLESVAANADPVTLERALRDADVVVTTPFHVDEVREHLSPGQPLVVVELHPAWRQAVEDHSREEPLLLLCLDRSAGDRIRDGLGPSLAERLRVETVEAYLDGPSVREPCLATAAAAARLPADAAPAGLTVLPYLSPRAARQVAHLVVGLNDGAPADRADRVEIPALVSSKMAARAATRAAHR